MENINNTINPETPIQPIETSVTPEPTPTPTNPNLFKYLFIISIVVLLIVIISFIFISNNKNSKQPPTVQNTNNISEVIPTAVPTAEVKVTPTSTIIDKTENNGPYIANGYFFVPSWGLKFKLSNELTDYGYSVEPNCIACSFDKYQIGLTAVLKKDLISNPQSRYYSTIDNCSFITVSKTTKDMSNVSGPKKVISTNSGSLVVYDFNASGSCKDEGVGLMTNNYYKQVADKLVEILSQPEQI